MPRLYNKQLGRETFVPDELLEQARASGHYVIPADMEVIVQTPRGRTVQAPLSSVAEAEDIAPVGEEAAIEARRKAYYREENTGAAAQAGTFLENFFDTAFLGVPGLIGRATDPEYAKHRRAREENYGKTAFTGKAAGLVGPSVAASGAGLAGKAARATGTGGATRVGAAASRAVGGGVKGAAAGFAAEGGILGLGAGAQELSLSEDPITLERIAETLSSNWLTGTVTGGVLGGGGSVVAKAGQKVLGRTKKALSNIRGQVASAPAVADDLVGKSPQELRILKEAETQAVKTAREAGKIRVAEEITDLYNDTQKSKWWSGLTDEKGKISGPKALRDASAISVRADKAIRNLVDVPKTLSRDPHAALRALERSETALMKVKEHLPDLVAKEQERGLSRLLDEGPEAFEKGSSRLKGLQRIDNLLERNRGIQKKIKDLYEPVSSPRLTQIEDAERALSMVPKKRTLVERVATGYAMGAMAGMVPGGAVGAAVSVLAPEIIRGLASMVMKRLGRAAGESAARSSKSLEAFLDVTKTVAAKAPPSATRVLAGISYGGEPKKTKNLREAYYERENELRGQTMMAPDGRIIMTPAARRRLGERLDPIRAVDQIAADRIETIAARRLEFLASKLPKLPDIAVTQPQFWQHGTMLMRQFARYAAAAEDPGGVEERLVDGTITPEDAEAYRTVYPERFMDIQRRIIEQLPLLRQKLPFHRRLALSIFSGIPVDPAMDPRVVRVLQAQYVQEPNTVGGTMPPIASPQFGSVAKSAPEPTPAQKRMG